MPLNLLGGEAKRLEATPVALPAITLPDLDTEREVREAVAAIAEKRTIRLGNDAWRLTQKSASFENWKLPLQA
jgi:hypothetical protein